MGSARGRWDDYFDTLRLSDEQLAAIMLLREQRKGCGLAPVRGAPAGVDLRLWRRINVSTCMTIPAEVTESSGTSRMLRVYPIDISSGGMCFLAPMFLHRGGTVRVTVRTRDDELLSVTGTIARCHLLSGKAHEVGVEFDQVFDVGVLDLSMVGPLSPDRQVRGGRRSGGGGGAAGGSKRAAEASRELHLIAGELSQRNAALAGRLRSIAESLVDSDGRSAA